MAQRRRDAQLHGHAPGVVLEPLVLRQVQTFEPPLVGVLLPVFEGPGHDPAQLFGAQDFRHKGLVQHHADVLLDGVKFPALVVHPQHGDRAPIPLQGVHGEADGGALAGPVLPHQAQDAPGRQVQIQVFQGEALVVLGQPPDLNGVGQFHSSCSSNQKMFRYRAAEPEARRRKERAARPAGLLLFLD